MQSIREGERQQQQQCARWCECEWGRERVQRITVWWLAQTLLGHSQRQSQRQSQSQSHVHFVCLSMTADCSLGRAGLGLGSGTAGSGAVAGFGFWLQLRFWAVGSQVLCTPAPLIGIWMMCTRRRRRRRSSSSLPSLLVKGRLLTWTCPRSGQAPSPAPAPAPVAGLSLSAQRLRSGVLSNLSIGCGCATLIWCSFWINASLLRRQRQRRHQCWSPKKRVAPTKQNSRWSLSLMPLSLPLSLTLCVLLLLSLSCDLNRC